MKKIYLLVLPLCLLWTTLACSMPGATPTPTPTPELAPNQVAFTAPYVSYLKANDYLPGANMQYVGEEPNGSAFLIDGVKALKKVGDSLKWKGPSAPGVTFNYDLRVIGKVLEQFEAGGTITIIANEPAPISNVLPPETVELHFDGVVIPPTTTIVKGGTLLGTQIGYVSNSDKGAEISGVDGYAFREEGDSIDWYGQVRSNVWVKLSLRVVSITDEKLTLTGTGEVWIDTP